MYYGVYPLYHRCTPYMYTSRDSTSYGVSVPVDRWSQEVISDPLTSIWTYVLILTVLYYGMHTIRMVSTRLMD